MRKPVFSTVSFALALLASGGAAHAEVFPTTTFDVVGQVEFQYSTVILCSYAMTIHMNNSQMGMVTNFKFTSPSHAYCGTIFNPYHVGSWAVSSGLGESKITLLSAKFNTVMGGTCFIDEWKFQFYSNGSFDTGFEPGWGTPNNCHINWGWGDLAQNSQNITVN